MGLSGGFGRLHRSRSGLAATLVAVLAVAALVLVFALRSKPAVVARPVSSSPSPVRTSAPPSPSAMPTLPNTFSYISLQPGDCFDSPAFSRSLTTLTKRTCTTPHDAEVTQLVALPTGLADYASIVHKALELCEPLDAAAFEKQSIKSLQYYELYPSLTEYQGGRHTVTCALSGGSYQGATKLTAPLAH
ncbi:hypothetical protein [Streptacidiphilus jiangxiensis]|uniref:Septum formation n=1 Tax=Streptacidiphilus jiangxiensis TaxID=235985 RepID=A0A1H7SKI1_STRJI|nr:hypothetical protein [Streptacidiphilus jiangxiensis]SEL72899.1 hypothetical protein SAMN05414137_11259 [Streptacidiphilus jiangxiensis]